MTQEQNAKNPSGNVVDIDNRFEIVTKHLVMAKELNAYGNLFGGILLAWLDEAAALFVMDKIGYANFVTVSLDDVVFRAPAFRGDNVYFYCRVCKIGRSSIEVQTKALVQEPTSRERREIITCQISFVCLKDGKPYPYFQSNAYRDWLQQQSLNNETLPA